jgi:hypothetical protein
MNLQRRKLILSALALPAGCSIQPLKPLASQPIASPARMPIVRPPAIGQSWAYSQFNMYNSVLLAIEQEQLAAVGPRIVITRQDGAGQLLPEEHHLNWGQMVRDPVWDFVQNYETPVVHWPAALQVGASEKVNTHYRVDNFSYRFAIDVTITAQAWERVTVAAGTFDVLRIDKFIRIQHYDHGRQNNVRRDTIWLAPETGRWVAREIKGEYQIMATKPFTAYEGGVRWELSTWS